MRCATALQVREESCDVWTQDEVRTARFAPQFPGPRTERVSPGHLLALAVAPDGGDVVVWRWYDAVVVGADDGGPVPLWEPAHGQVRATPRPSYVAQEPGRRVYASAGLPGADWWATGPVTGAPEDADVDLDEVVRLYTERGLWAAALGTSRHRESPP